MDVEASLAWLFSFSDWERGVGWNPRASADESWKLGRTRALLDLAGAPDRALRRLTIVGTNGKGSTGAILEAILGAAGRRTGVYSQPHLHAYRERIRIDGAPVAPAAFAAGASRLRALVDRLADAHPEAGEPTTFELTTALAAMLFADAGVEVAVLEAGLGGRLDAVNAIDSDLVLVTSIGHDHVQILGGTLASIAREKAGVLRRGALALSAVQRPTAARALAREARRIGAALRTIEPLPAAAGPLDPARGQRVCRPADGGGCRSGWLRLLGRHQRQNAALAVEAARALLGPGHDRAIARGLAEARWPGRLEWVPGAPPVVIDGAHNPPGASAIAEALDELLAGLGPAGQPRVGLVFGCARDKRAGAILRPLLRRATRTWTVAADDRRASDPEALAALARRLGGSAEAATSVGAGLAAARAAGLDLVVVAGSLRVVAEARTALGLT
jgi:dihydrofolate synthase/folylpolyglutamate synthase